VCAAFDASYVRQDPAIRRMFRLLGLVAGPDVTVESAGALTGVPAADALVGTSPA